MKSLTILFSLVILPFATFSQPLKNQISKKVVIDVNISQPNVENCFITDIPGTDTPLKDLKIFPNPNNGQFKLQIENFNPLDEVNLQIFNLDGRLVYSYKAKLKDLDGANSKNYLVDINVTSQPKGVYFIHVCIENQKSIQKLIVI